MTMQSSCLMVVALIFVSTLAISHTASLQDDEPQKSNFISGDVQGSDGQLQKNVFLAPRAAKSFLRVRRGWGIKRLTGEEEEEEEEGAERRREAQRRAQLARTCSQQCWGQWSGFNACSVPCGSSGIRRRTRSVSPPSQCTVWVRQHGCRGSSTDTQPCNRTCRNGGVLRPNDCACHAGFKGRCCEQRVTCSYPGKPSNGDVTPSGSSHAYNTVARFSCKTGYRLIGSSTRKCQNNGQWSSSVPSCQIVSCGNPGQLAHGNIQGTVFTYGRNVVYSCVEGYNLQGSKTRRCEASGRWTPAPATCIPVTCPRPPSPSSGSVKLNSGNIYRSVAEYICSNGFHLEGSQRRTCQLTGSWDGTQPVCKQITCPVLPAPANGFVVYRNSRVVLHGDEATYTCKSGYALVGVVTRKCTGSGPHGVWTNEQPTCAAVSCGNPGIPIHGTTIGSSHTFPNYVTFHCLPGYYMTGTSRVTCRSNRQWTNTKPSCNACQLNTYNVGANAVTHCTSCPAHSVTRAQASTDLKQCICDNGYEGPFGGPCQLIRCPVLNAPENGQLSPCDNVVNSTCTFECHSGYTRSQGTSSRVCHMDATWSGVQPVCSACPRNTYKSDSVTCSACPVHSHSGSASSLDDCLCDPGYIGPPGGPCNDIDECSQDGKGDCQQACENLPGSYKCICDIPGFDVDPYNNKKCIAVRSCSSLEPPANGGLVCVRDHSTNTERCDVKCNNGYEHIDRTNAFEECGPTTNWLWSYETSFTPVLPCVEQFFEGIVIEAEVAYFVDQCDKLTDQQIRSVQLQFVRMLRSRGICAGAAKEDVCDITNVEVECGELDSFMFSRRKRSTNTQLQQLKIKFDIRVPTMSRRNVNCSAVCDDARINDTSCERYCTESYHNMSLATLDNAATKLKTVFNANTTTHGTRQKTKNKGTESGNENTDEDVTFNVETYWQYGLPALKIGDQVLMPAGQVTTHNATVSCDAGMAVVNGKCLPCPAGTYLSSNESQCVACHLGTYQPLTQMTLCLPCDDVTNHTGAVNCSNPVTTPTPEPTTTTDSTTAITLTTPSEESTDHTTEQSTTPTTQTTTQQQEETTTLPRKHIVIHINFGDHH